MTDENNRRNRWFFMQIAGMFAVLACVFAYVGIPLSLRVSGITGSNVRAPRSASQDRQSTSLPA